LPGESRVLRECCGLSAKFTGCPSRDGALGVIGVVGRASLMEDDLYVG